jgi:hypothetical protein
VKGPDGSEVGTQEQLEPSVLDEIMDPMDMQVLSGNVGALQAELDDEREVGE